MIPRRLAAMANQIAASVPDPERAPALTAEHLRTFWAPAMIAELDAYAVAHPDDLDPAVRAALAQMRVRPDQRT